MANFGTAVLLQRMLNGRSNKESEEEMAMEPATILLTSDDLISLARKLGSFEEYQKVINLTHITGQDNQLAVVVLFEPRARTMGNEVTIEIPEKVEEIDYRLHDEFSIKMLDYILQEIAHDPPHMNVIGVSDVVHMMRQGDRTVPSGEVTISFRVMIDPDHYAESIEELK